MARNNIEKYATILQSKLDEMVVREATSGWMEGNAIQVNYTGGKKVEIGELSTTGLKDYDRDNGFPKGSVSLNYYTREMTQDRGTTFHIDRMDNDETAFLLNAAAVIGTFQKTQVIPEIDAYRYSSLATQAIETGKHKADFTATEANILKQLLDDIGVIEDIYGEGVELVVTMPGHIKRLLEMNDKWQRMVNIAEFTKGGINTKVHAINTNKFIITAPQDRLKSKIQILDGETAGQEAGGFKPATGALDINWLITLHRAPLAINKTDKLRIFTPDVNQQADAWKIDFRKYHDLWVKKHQLKGIFVNTKPLG